MKFLSQLPFSPTHHTLCLKKVPHVLSYRLLPSLMAVAALTACGGDGADSTPEEPAAPLPVQTPVSLSLEKIGSYASGVFLQSAAEIPAFDAKSQRGFIVNAQKGAVDVLDMRNPAQPVLLGSMDATALLSGASINSVAVHDGLVAVAVQAADKTAPGRIALYRADTLQLQGHAQVGSLPDMLTFTPDGKTVLVANEGEPSNDYQVDPQGSISVVDISNPAAPSVRTAGFEAFNHRKADLLAQGVRIFGPTADGKSTTTVAQDLEPEYIAVAADGRTAWATLQENNALAVIDVINARITDVVPLGYKDHGLSENALDYSDSDNRIHITTAPGLLGMYQPDAIASYQAVDGNTYLVTANEGDARAWGGDNPAYFGVVDTSGGDVTQGFVEEFRIKHLVHNKGFLRRAGDDLPAHLYQLADGALLNPQVFAWCGAKDGDAGSCREDNVLGRLKVTWTKGYRTHVDGSPVYFNAKGEEDPTGRRLMYDHLYTYGTRSLSVWNTQGHLVWDSGAAIEQFLASDACKLGSQRNLACKDFFNTGHDETAIADARSAAKGPEPEGVAVGSIGAKTFAFVGLERMGGVLVFDITNPSAPTQADYINTRENWATEFDDKTPPAVLSQVGDLGPEGLHFIPAAQSPNGQPLLMVGNEVSGTTSIYQLNLKF